MDPESESRILRALAPFEPLAAYLYGSAATGSLRPDSDIDVAFLPATRPDAWTVFEAAQRLAGELGREVDLVDLTDSSTVFRFEVITTGRRILCADRDRVAEFEMYAYSDYARLNEERREVLEAYGMRLP